MIQFIAPQKKHPDGYGNSTWDLRSALEESGLVLNKDNNDLKHDFEFSLIYGPADYARNVVPGVKYGIYTMWETEQHPDHWKTYLEGAEFIVVPSKWEKEAIRNQFGLEKNVFVIPLAYKTDEFTYIKRPDREKFTFLSYNSGFGAIRKGFNELIEAYKIAFQPSDNVKIIIKSVRPDLFGDAEKFIWDGIKGAYDIQYIALPYPIEGLKTLLFESDCFVFPSRGEGWGHTPLEAMATGLPCIIPNEHGISEYFKANINYTYETERKTAYYDDHKMAFGTWKSAKPESLADTMRYVYENQKEATVRGYMGSQYVKKYRYDYTANNIIELIKKYT